MAASYKEEKGGLVQHDVFERIIKRLTCVSGDRNNSEGSVVDVRPFGEK